MHFLLGIIKDLAKFDALLLQLMFFVILQKLKSNVYSLHAYTWPTASDTNFLLAGKKITLYVSVPFKSTLKEVSHSSFLYAGNIKVQYFLNTGMKLAIS